MWYYLIIRTCFFAPKQTKATQVIQQKPGNIDKKMGMLKQYTPLSMFGAIKHSFGRKLICEFNLIDIIYLTLHIAKDIYPYFYQPLLCLPSFLLLVCCGVVACSLCFKIIVFKTFFQEHCPSVKQLRSRSGPKLLLVISAEHRHSVDFC